MEAITILVTGWAVVRPEGTVEICTRPGATEQDVWWMTYGYLDRVAAAKARGARAVRCEVREIGGKGERKN